MEMNVNMQKLTAGLPLGKAPPVPSSVPRRGYFISEVWPFTQPKESPIQTAFKTQISSHHLTLAASYLLIFQFSMTTGVIFKLWAKEGIILNHVVTNRGL